MTVSVTIDDCEDSFIIRLNGKLHLYANWHELVAIQTYDQNGKYWIDYHFKGANTVTSEYDEELWNKVLKALEKMVWE